MKRIGIIGGIGPESTVDYYQRIIGAFKSIGDGFTYPEIIIYSADLSALMQMVHAGQRDQITEWLLARVAALHKAGAEFGVIGSNTPHAVFDQVQARSPIPLLSIVEATCRHAQRLGLRRLGLMGTQFTMESDFYQNAFSRLGMAMEVPDAADRERIQHWLFTEIELGIIRESTRQELLAIAKKMIDSHAIDGLVLGCTELPLILDQPAFGIPFLNTTAIHAQEIIDYCLGKESTEEIGAPGPTDPRKNKRP